MKTTIHIYLDIKTLGYDEYEQISSLPPECKIILLCSKYSKETVPVSFLTWALGTKNKIEWLYLDIQEDARASLICYEAGRILGKRVRTRKQIPIYLISKDSQLRTAASNLKILFPPEQYGTINCCTNVKEVLKQMQASSPVD